MVFQERKARSLDEVTCQEAVARPYVSRILRLAFLAPDLIEAVLEGRQSDRLTLESIREPIRLDWAEQRRLLSTDPA
jgi:hypothetical protein